jgi:hypothetical protein
MTKDSESGMEKHVREGFFQGLWRNSKMVSDRDFYLFVWGQLVGIFYTTVIFLIWRG